MVSLHLLDWRPSLGKHEVLTPTCIGRWPGAYNHGAYQIGLGSQNGSIYGVNPGDALSSITGLRTNITGPGTIDEFWTTLGQVQALKTPIVLSPQLGAKTLVINHGYAVINTTMAGDIKMYVSRLFTAYTGTMLNKFILS